MHIAYFVNQYPKVSHSFIRREIQSLEKQGVKVSRYALRGWDADVVDSEDKSEAEKTQYLLQSGPSGLLLPALKQLLTNFYQFFVALILAVKTGWNSQRPLLYHLVYLAEACKLIEFVRESGCTHIHAHFGTNSTEVVMLARVLGGPSYSFTVHGPEEFDSPRGLNLKDKIKHSKFVVAISSYGRSQLYRWADFEDWRKINIVHCGLDAAFYDVPVKPIAATNRLVCIGRLCEQKGQLLLVEAAQKLQQQGLSFELILAGDGEMRAEVERLIALYKLGDKVKITGWIDSNQVRQELLDARAMVLPSFAEGLPVVIMEALALHRPVLTTYVAGIPELVINGENGWLFPAGSVNAIADALAECLNTPVNQLNLMGEAGFNRVVERHNIDIEAGKLVKLFASNRSPD